MADRRDRHLGHVDHDRMEELTARLRTDAHEPLELAGKVIRIDTSKNTDPSRLAAEIRRAYP